MDRPTVTNSHAVAQAGMTIGQYLSQAKTEIDRVFWNGFDEENPALVAECVRSQTLDYNNTALTDAIYELSDAIKTTPLTPRSE
jgi:hypothetical protein